MKKQRIQEGVGGTERLFRVRGEAVPPPLIFTDSINSINKFMDELQSITDKSRFFPRVVLPSHHAYLRLLTIPRLEGCFQLNYG